MSLMMARCGKKVAVISRTIVVVGRVRKVFSGLNIVFLTSSETIVVVGVSRTAPVDICGSTMQLRKGI